MCLDDFIIVSCIVLVTVCFVGGKVAERMGW